MKRNNEKLQYSFFSLHRLIWKRDMKEKWKSNQYNICEYFNILKIRKGKDRICNFYSL